MPIWYSNIYKNIDFGLYSFSADEMIDFEETKKSVLKAFKDKYEKEIKKRLVEVGLKYHKLNYYSPQYYNYQNDSMETLISVANKTKLKKAILQNKEKIQNALNTNKSYPGYIKTTIDSVEDELEQLEKKDYEPDIIVVQELLDLECDPYDVFENIVYDSEADL